MANDQNEDSKKVEIKFQDRGILAPTFTSLATATFSGGMAYMNAPKPQLDDMDAAGLGLIVAMSTFLGAKIGKKIGMAAGTFAGMILGGTFGAAAGTAVSDKEEKGKGAVAGGVVGAVSGAVLMALVGAATGFFGGAYLGHTYGNKGAMKYVFNKSNPAETQPQAAPAQSSNAGPRHAYVAATYAP